MGWRAYAQGVIRHIHKRLNRLENAAQPPDVPRFSRLCATVYARGRWEHMDSSIDVVDFGLRLSWVLLVAGLGLAARCGAWLAARLQRSATRGHAEHVEEQKRRLGAWALRQGLQWNAGCWHGSWNGHDLKLVQRKSGNSLSAIYILVGACLGPDGEAFPERSTPVWKPLFVAHPCLTRARSLGADLELKLRWNAQPEEIEAVFRSLSSS
jgi:hypothetical protein